MIKKLFTSILLLGVALCGWATITETLSGNTVTLNYVADGNSSDQNFNLSNTNATTIVLTGDWANKDLQKIGSIVGQCSGYVFLDLSACTKMVSKVQYTGQGDTDWTSSDFVFLPDANYPETVQRTGTATKVTKYYESWGDEYTGDATLEQHDDGLWYEPGTSWNGKTAKDVYLDENGKQLPDNATITENNGTYSYSYTETLDTTKFSLASDNFSNNANKLGGIAFPDHENFTAVPDQVFGETGPTDLTSATVGSNVVWIGEDVFKSTKITSFDFPAGLKVIGGEAFHGAPLDEVDLSGCTSLVAIKYEAFEEVNQNKGIDVTFPEGSAFTFIGNDAFRKSGIKSLDMSMCNGITEFQNYNNDYKTFSDCKFLTSVSLPPNLSAVPDDTGMGVFNASTNIASVTCNGTARYVDCELQNPLYIGDAAFKEKLGLATVILCNRVSSIGYETFHSAAITEIHIPASVETLKKHAFYNCQQLKNVYFDAFDKSLGNCKGAETWIAGDDGAQGNGAFEECQNITDVYILTEALLHCQNNAFDQDITWGAGNVEGNFATLHYPKDNVANYVNLTHYLSDKIIKDPGLFHLWLHEHYDLAGVPNKNGWYEFINSGPFDPENEEECQSIILRTFSDNKLSYLVPNGLRAYVVSDIQPAGDNYEVTLTRIPVIPKQTGVILYGHPNGKTSDGKPTLVLTPVEFAPAGETIELDGGQTITAGENEGLPLCRANWDNNYVKNYLEPILSEDGSAVPIKPYEKVDGVVTFRNFGLGRYSSTDYFNTTALTSDENNYVGFFRMKPQSYKSGYAYLRLAPGEFDAADGGEILVKPDTQKDLNNGILSYSCEYKLTDGKVFDAADAVGTAANPKGWWNASAIPVGFYWKEYSMSWGDRTIQFGGSAAAKYFGEFEDDTDGIVKLVVPADNISNGEYYTLQGVKVNNPTKGVYILNGKKVIVK